jgi:hypothetical protein
VIAQLQGDLLAGRLLAGRGDDQGCGRGVLHRDTDGLIQGDLIW